MKILVQNRQRRYKIDRHKVEDMANKLSIAIFDNLRNNKLPTKWMPYLNDIEKTSVLHLIILSPQAIKKLNKEWLHKDKKTDVLSFPLLDLSSPKITEELRVLCSSHKAKISEGSDSLFEFGELFISYEQAIKQAKEYNHSLDRELAFLFVHGFLHLFGFDHQDKISEKEMFGRQRAILNKSNYFR